MQMAHSNDKGEWCEPEPSVVYQLESVVAYDAGTTAIEQAKLDQNIVWFPANDSPPSEFHYDGKVVELRQEE